MIQDLWYVNLKEWVVMPNSDKAWLTVFIWQFQQLRHIGIWFWCLLCLFRLHFFPLVFPCLIVFCCKLDIMHEIISAERNRPLMWDILLINLEVGLYLILAVTVGQRFPTLLVPLIFVSSIDLGFSKYSSWKGVWLLQISVRIHCCYRDPSFM